MANAGFGSLSFGSEDVAIDRHMIDTIVCEGCKVFFSLGSFVSMGCMDHMIIHPHSNGGEAAHQRLAVLLVHCGNSTLERQTRGFWQGTRYAILGQFWGQWSGFSVLPFAEDAKWSSHGTLS